MKELLEKIKLQRIHNILFSNMYIDSYGVFRNRCDIQDAFMCRENEVIIILYKVVEKLLGTHYNRYIHDIIVKFFGSECLLFQVDYDTDELYYITFEKYEKISRKD